MPSHALRLLAGLSILAALLWRLLIAPASPKALPTKTFGLAFEKQLPQNALYADRLLRRQKSLSIDIDNADIAYLVNITVGTPPQAFRVTLNSGSGDTFIPSVDADACTASTCKLGTFDSSDSSSFLEVGPARFSIEYQDGTTVSGDFISDTVSIGGAAIDNVTMGLANKTTLTYGILGLGYEANEAIASHDPNATYPNFVSQLQKQGLINTRAYSLWLNDINSSTGSILFGGVDTAKFHGGLSILPIQKSSNDTYTDFTVALSSVALADASGETVFLQNDLALPVILLSGTTASYLPEIIINPILNGIGATNDPSFGLIIPCSTSSSPAIFNFGFGGTGGPLIEVSFGEFVEPIFQGNGSQTTSEDGIALCNFGLMSAGTGPVILGENFLRSVYAVYDLTNNQIGLAQTNFNATDSNVLEIFDSSIPSATATVSGLTATETFAGFPQDTEAATKSGSSEGPHTLASPSFDIAGAATSGASSATGGASSTAVTTSTAATGTSTQQPNHQGISHSTKFGIGLGVPFGMMALASIAYVLYRHWKKKHGLQTGRVDDIVTAEKRGPIDGDGPQTRREEFAQGRPLTELHGESIPDVLRELEGSPGDTRKELP